MQVFTARRLVTPADVVDNAWMAVEEGRIVEVGSHDDRQAPAGRAHTDFGQGMIVPGYIDLHIHGSAGCDVMDEKAEALPAIERMLVRHGVTSYLPTTVTAPLERILRALERLADAVEKHGGDICQGRAAPLGIHLEGPFISHARRGVHPEADLLPPKTKTFERFWQAARGHIRMMTIAPELDGSTELIHLAAARGVCLSLGHSDAPLADTERAIAAGASHATHIFNAMRPLEHRDPGILGGVLTDSRVSADLIADGVHVDPTIVKLAAKAKGADLTVLITDATAAAGMPDGRYRLGSIAVDVHDGKCTYEGKLAGSTLTMDRAVRNLSSFAGWTLEQAVAAATRNPARTVRLSGKGALSPGTAADFAVISEGGQVLQTFAGGVECRF